MLNIVIVLYNKSCNDSEAIRSLIEIPEHANSRIFVYDNSSPCYIEHNNSFCQHKNFIYIAFGHNDGLSKAYNYVIRQIHEPGYLLILDDDTTINKEYLSEAFNYVKKGNCNEIILPIVVANNKILSPCNEKFGKGIKAIHDLSDIDYKNITGINSGMLVGLKVYEQVKYNESLFLDCVDHDFCFEARKKNIPIIVVEHIIKQNYSRNNHANKDSAKKRFEIYKKDFYVFSKKFNSVHYYYYHLFAIALKHFFIYKDIWFLYKYFEAN